MPETPDLTPSGFRQVSDSFAAPPAQVRPGDPTTLGVSGDPVAPNSTGAPQSGPAASAVTSAKDSALPVPPVRPLPSPSPASHNRRRFVVAGVAIVLFGALAAITSWLAIPNIEQHLEAESRQRLEEAGITGATVELDGRIATISGLTGDDAQRAEAILDDEWGIRDAKLAPVDDPEPLEVTADTVPPPATSTLVSDTAEPVETTEPSEEDDPDIEDAPATTQPAEADLNFDDELAALELRFNNNGAFQPGSAALTAEAEAILTDAATLLEQFPEATILVEGHTDNDGDQIANLLLSQARADAVVDFLVDNDIDASRLIAVGLGENEPAADNNTAEGRAQNRRTEFFAVR